MSPETVDENSMEIPTTVFNTIPNMMVTSPYSNITSVNAMMTTSDPMMSCTNSKQTKVLLQPRFKIRSMRSKLTRTKRSRQISCQCPVCEGERSAARQRRHLVTVLDLDS